MTKRMTVVLLIGPAVIIIVTLFIGGFLFGLFQSFGYMPIVGQDSFSTEAYRHMFADTKFFGSLFLTLWISIAATFLTVVFSIITALVMRQAFKGKRFINFLYQFPITIPHLVIGIGIILLLSQSGMFARIFYNLGIISDQSEFPVLVFDDLGMGIIFVYLWKQIPFMGLVVISILQSVGNDYEELARSLGANKWQSFRFVLLPLIIPGILPTSIICFAYTFGAFEVPYLLGKPYPAVLSVLAYRLFENVDLNARPEAMAMAVFIAVFISILVVVYKRVMKQITGRA